MDGMEGMPSTPTGSEVLQGQNDLVAQLLNLLRNGIHNTTTTVGQSQQNSETVNIGIKLNASNYPLWSRLMRVMTKGLTEILWIRKLMTDLGLLVNGTCRLMCDNKAAISISENPVQHDRTKHVEVDRHFIKEKLEEGIVEFPFVRSEDQLADILTKAVRERVFQETLIKLGIGDPTIQLEGECEKNPEIIGSNYGQ
ncbi:hypothetical protein MLD38_021583 [Melastoma candidum]|uniref:Uncharacterized protein n=1 Tax=Melastoma candidum TaxID=119954 RepID=A0ACB9QJY0_9MYRT|nr:hypothetical protein MLD38_021583 [Melastoma candidum]